MDDFIGSAGSVSGYTLTLVNVDAAGLRHTTSINEAFCSNINPYDVLSHDVLAGDLALSSVGDHGLNLAYMIGSLGTGSSITLTYAYAVGERIEDRGGTGRAVPEPATWALMIGGFAFAGASMRRRRATVSFA